MNAMTKIAADRIDPQWYLLRVMPQSEHLVAYLLRKRGVSTFIPTEVRTLKRSSYAKGKAKFAVPTIPSVIFVGFPGPPAWFDVMRIHMILGPVSLTSDGEPTRLDFVKLFKFFNRVNDGCMVFDGGLRLIQIPGHDEPIRALTTRVRTVSRKERAHEEPGSRGDQAPSAVRVQAAPRLYADFLSRFVHGAQLT